MSIWRLVVASFLPSQYTRVREASIPRIAGLIAFLTVLAVAVFIALLIPSILSSNDVLAQLRETTNLTLDAQFNQSAPTYLIRNPDVLVSTSGGDAFIVVSPEGLTVRSWIVAGERTYPWVAFHNITSFPIRSALVPLFVFLVPSLLVWATMVLLANIALATISFMVLGVLAFRMRRRTLAPRDAAKVALLATVPSLSVFALLPVLRLGLPLTVIAGFAFALWLTLSLLGATTLAVDEVKPKFSPKTKR